MDQFEIDEYCDIGSKDLLVKVKLQNNRIWSLARQKWGDLNQSELAKRTGIDISSIGCMLNFKMDVITKKAHHQGTRNKPVMGYKGLYWKRAPTILAEALNVLPEALFPEEFRSPKQNYYELEVSKAEALAFTAVHSLPENPEALLIREENKHYLKMAVSGLEDRYQYVIRNRYGLDGIKDTPMSLDELARKMDITSARVLQIEKKALEKLKLALPYEEQGEPVPKALEISPWKSAPHLQQVPQKQVPQKEVTSMERKVAALEKEVERLQQEVRTQGHLISALEHDMKYLMKRLPKTATTPSPYQPRKRSRKSK